MSASPNDQSGLLLAGDIGGTKTLLAVYSAEQGPREPLAIGEFSSAEYPSLAAVVAAFRPRMPQPVTHACFAVAGPVLNGAAKITNLPWDISEAGLGAQLGLRTVTLLNDLLAVAIAIPSLRPEELHTISAGEPEAGGALAVVAPGTGLGEAFLTYDGGRYRAFPSEGGHAAFAPATERQARLLDHLRQRFGHVSVERVCSGPGLLSIYDFLRDDARLPESEAMAAQLETAADKPRLIGEAALRRPAPDPLSRSAVDLLVEILASEAGNLALKVLATGGVYLAGGMPARLLPALGPDAFMAPFSSKGRLSPMLRRIPVHVVLARAGLLGAALTGLG